MAKHVFSNGELPHAFFYQQEHEIDWGKGSNLSFNKDKIYSYSTCIGVADFDRKIFLFKAGSYSISTSKHRRNIRAAIPHGWRVYYVNSWIGSHGYSHNNFGYNEATYRGYFNDALTRLIEEKNHLLSGITRFGYDIYSSVIHDLQEFSTDMNCEYLLDEYLPQLEVYKWTPEMIEMCNVKTWCKENGITGSYATKLKVYENPELADEVIAKNKLKKVKLDAAEEEADLKKLVKSIENWYNYEGRIYLGKSKYFHWLKEAVYLRLKQSDPTMVETSKSVTIPLIECALLYRKFKQCVDTNTEWKQNGEKFRIGHYYVNKIYNNGGWKLQAGCHLIHQEQIEEFVNKFTDWNKT